MRTLLQFPVQSRVSHPWSLSRLLRAWSSQVLKPSKAKPIALAPQCPPNENFLLKSRPNFSCFNFCPLSLLLPLCSTLKSLASSLKCPLCRQWEKLLSPLKAMSSPVFTSHLFFLPKISTAAADYPADPLMVSLYWYLACIRGTKSDAAS